ncbi:MAG: sugar kinase [Deltaproteobacteria bacterium]|nr:sugar kinase [Deltaproteobacteria bacterium]
MLAVVGTIPAEDFPLTAGKVHLETDRIRIADHRIPINRGTPALLAAALCAAQVMGGSPVFAYLVGDTGLGRGSRRLYEYLAERLGEAAFHTIAFHYLQPDVDWHNKVLFAIDDMNTRPTLVADAGFMYAAKMSGQSAEYDLFTPDAGELAFLADEEAPHPFYTRGFILHDGAPVPELIARAYANDNAARYLLVKGEKDHVADRSGILDTVDRPAEAAMEAIGGTGDTLTGIVSALIAAGLGLTSAALLAARVNRFAGLYAKPTPATQVMDLIRHIPTAMQELFEKKGDEKREVNA